MTDIQSLNLYATRSSLRSLAVLILMFSLAGIPPFLGFFAKYGVLRAAVDAHMIWLAVMGALASVFAAFYYLRIVYFMYFGTETDPLDERIPPVQWVMLVGSAALMLLGVINLFGLEGPASFAAHTLVR